MTKPTRMNENRQNSLSATTSASRLDLGRAVKCLCSVGAMVMYYPPLRREVSPVISPADAHHSAARTQTRSSAFRSQATENFQAQISHFNLTPPGRGTRRPVRKFVVRC